MTKKTNLEILIKFRRANAGRKPGNLVALFLPVGLFMLPACSLRCAPAEGRLCALFSFGCFSLSWFNIVFLGGFLSVVLFSGGIHFRRCAGLGCVVRFLFYLFFYFFSFFSCFLFCFVLSYVYC